ncbi:MotE family protein [Sphingomonas sp. AP4-R1]|uniref:MotE family protein n=1 Tax=Sphingomonas sp. AP4-R1 TaxID=2735134 RepID=UPI001C11A832|nr:magnesium transporter [Sphingomonas sp. AP4-R1]
MTGAPASNAPAPTRARGRLLRPSLLSLTIAAVGVSAVAHAMTVAGAAQAGASAPPPTRLGVSIQQSMSERDQEIARRMRAATLREQSARAVEQRLKADAESRRAQTDAQAKAGADDAEAPKPIEDLARIYQTMKPARAAPIFAALDLDIQTQIARRMRERAVALLMANMDPLSAVRLSMSLAGRRPIALAVPVTPAAQMQVTETRAQPPAPAPREKASTPAPAGERIASAADARQTTRPRVPTIAAPRVAPEAAPVSR